MNTEVLTEPPPPPPPVAKRGRLGPIAVIVGVTLVLSLVTLGLVLRAESRQDHEALASRARGVTAVTARAKSWRDERRYVGVVEPWLEARLGPQLVSSWVETVLVRPGDKVKRGDVVATLDCRNATGGSETVAMQARSLEARQQAMASEAARLQNLVGGGFVSENEVEQKKAQAASNEAQLEAFRAQLRNRNLEVSDCTLRAPFDGEIAMRSADPGTFVRPGSTVVTVVDRHVSRVVLDVPEGDFVDATVGAPVEVRLLATGKSLRAAISRRAPAANEATRTVRFEVDLASQDVPVGTTADVHLAVGEPRDAVQVPLTAAKVRGGSATLYVVDHDVAKKVQAPVLGERGGALFLGGVAAGAVVVTDGRNQLSDGEHVAVKLDPSWPPPEPLAAAPAPEAKERTP